MHIVISLGEASYLHCWPKGVGINDAVNGSIRYICPHTRVHSHA